MGCIYKVENKINGNIYIGKTIQPFSKRKYQHLWDARNYHGNMIFHKAIRISQLVYFRKRDNDDKTESYKPLRPKSPNRQYWIPDGKTRTAHLLSTVSNRANKNWTEGGSKEGERTEIEIDQKTHLRKLWKETYENSAVFGQFPFCPFCLAELTLSCLFCFVFVFVAHFCWKKCFLNVLKS